VVARKGFSASVFRTHFYHTAPSDRDPSLSRWRGFRVVADASDLQLFLKDASGRKVRETLAASDNIYRLNLLSGQAGA
jgi:hypothetical protein